MEGQLASPFHFAAEFLILAVCAGAMFDAIRAYREDGGGRTLVQAAGFGALVVAQIVHGALLVQGDGDLSIVALRAVGFGLLALAPRAPGVIGMPAIFFAGADAQWAVIPAVLALLAAARTMASRRSDPRPATPALAGSFAFFAAGEVALMAAAPGGGVALAAAHGLRTFAALLLARWLWLSIVRSVRLRFVAAFVAGLVLLVTVVAAALTQVIGANLQDAELARLQQAARGQQSALQQRVNQAIQFAGALAQTGTIVQGYAAGPATLGVIARSAMSNLPSDLDFVAFADAQGKIVASAIDLPKTYPPLDQLEQIALGGSDAVRGALDGANPTVAGEVTSVGPKQIAAIGAREVATKDKRILGAVVVGYRLDRQLLLGLQVGAEAEITVLKGGEVVATTFENASQARGLVDRDHRTEVRRIVEEQGRLLLTTASTGGQTSFTVYAPLRSDDLQHVVGVLALSRPAVLLAASQRTINRTLFLITLGASVIAAALAWLLSGRVTRPIRALTHAARQVRGGDLDARATVDLPDEVGTLGAAFNEMAMSLKRMTDDLRGAADEEANLRARMEAIMQSMGDALVATDNGGSIVAFNRAAEDMLGRTGEKTIGKKLSDVLVGASGTGRALSEVVLAGRGANGTGTVESTDGRHVPVALSGAPLLDASGESVGRVIVLRDISREHEAERMKSEFLSNVSHELRTPLTPIKGYTEILRRKKFPREKAQGFLDGIMESTNRLERIVEILVDFAAMEAGRLKPRLEPVDLRRFLGDVVEAWRGRGAPVKFAHRLPADLPPVLGDERLLRKCVDELVDNAVKFSPKGGTVEIDAEPVVSAGRRGQPNAVRVMVRDRGIGIEPSQMASLFQDFRQLDGSETRAYGGLGLGLSYAKRVAKAHHGDITATSVPGHGSIFRLVLPAVKIRMAAGSPKRLPETSSTRVRKVKRVAAARAPKRVARRTPSAPRSPQARRSGSKRASTSKRATTPKRSAAPKRKTAPKRAAAGKRGRR